MVVTTGITFDLDDDKILGLRKVADNKNVSLNTLVEYLLGSYLGWDLLSAKEDSTRGIDAPAHKSVLRALFEKLSDEELRVLAVMSANQFRNLALLNKLGKFDIGDILSLTASRAKRSGFTLRIFNDVDGDLERVVTRHNMGYRWSMFFTIFMMKLINDAGYAVKSKLADNGWSIELSKTAALSAKERMNEMQYWPKFEFK